MVALEVLTLSESGQEKARFEFLDQKRYKIFIGIYLSPEPPCSRIVLEDAGRQGSVFQQVECIRAGSAESEQLRRRNREQEAQQCHGRVDQSQSYRRKQVFKRFQICGLQYLRRLTPGVFVRVAVSEEMPSAPLTLSHEAKRRREGRTSKFNPPALPMSDPCLKPLTPLLSSPCIEPTPPDRLQKIFSWSGSCGAAAPSSAGPTLDLAPTRSSTPTTPTGILLSHITTTHQVEIPTLSRVPTSQVAIVLFRTD